MTRPRSHRRGLRDRGVFIGVCRPWSCNRTMEQKAYKSPAGEQSVMVSLKMNHNENLRDSKEEKGLNSPRWSRGEPTFGNASRLYHGKTEDCSKATPSVKNQRVCVCRHGPGLHAAPSSARSCRRSESARQAPASTPGARCNCYS